MLVENFIKSNRNAPKFGVGYLDKKLGGIAKGDLILIGARSGAGKSTIADNIAIYNSQRGKKVTLISLENFKDENIVTKTYFRYKKLTGRYDITISDFWMGNFEYDKEKLEEAEIWANEQYKNINIINRDEQYTLEDLENTILKECGRSETDLIILDHLDYMDKMTPNQSDIEHISDLMKLIRQQQYIWGIPFVAISHLRKPQNARDKVIIPSVDEFIGSSNKVKESTCVIMLSPDDEFRTMYPYRETKATWCCIRKLRRGGVDNTCARLAFNTRTGTYEEEYKEFSVNYSGTQVEEKTR